MVGVVEKVVCEIAEHVIPSYQQFLSFPIYG